MIPPMTANDILLHDLFHQGIVNSFARRPPAIDEIRIDIDDQLPIYYKKEQLSKLSFFRNLIEQSPNRILTLDPTTDIKALKLVINAVLEDKSIEDLLDEELLQKPNLREWINNALNLYCPEKANHFKLK